MKKLKIGMVSLMHKNFTGDKDGQFKRSISEMQKLQEELGFDLYIVKNGVVTDDEALAAKKELEEQNIDFLMLQHTSFSSGTIVPIFSKLNVYMGLWAVPETRKDGAIPFNSFCAVNMNASIIGEYLKEYDIPFKWFYGNCYDDLFLNRFKITVKALTAIKNLKESRVALIGGISNGFDNQYFDERKIEKQFGVKIYRNHEFSELKNRMLSYSSEEVSDILERVSKDSCSIAPVAKDSMEKNARLIKAVLDFKKDNNYDALAINCWPKFRQELQMVSCAAIGRLNYENNVTACEGDIFGLLTMMTMRFMTEYPTLLLDLSDIDEVDQSILFWHCGIGCNNLAHNGKVWMNSHCNPGPIPGKGMVLAAPVAEMVFAKQKATIARFTKEGEGLFLLSGEFKNPDKKSFDGTRGWLYDLELAKKPISVRDLMNTLIIQRMQHHYAMASGDLTNEMMEVAAWLKMKPIKEVKYKDYMQNEYNKEL